MIRHLLLNTLACVLAAGTTAGTARAESPAPSRLAYDFNAANTWPAATGTASAGAVATTVTWRLVGTIDLADTVTASGALLLTLDSAKAGAGWDAALVSGPLVVATGETDPGKLTLGFMLAASAPLPVTVRIESLDARG